MDFSGQLKDREMLLTGDVWRRGKLVYTMTVFLDPESGRVIRVH